MANTKMQLLRTTEELVKVYFQYDNRAGGGCYPKTDSFKGLLSRIEYQNYEVQKVILKYLMNFKKNMPTTRAFLVKFSDRFSIVFTKNCEIYYHTFDDKYNLVSFVPTYELDRWVAFEEIDFSDRQGC